MFRVLRALALPSVAVAVSEMTETAAPEAPPCAKHGVAYSYDEDTVKTMPNGAYLTSPADCQRSCGMKPDCTHFTWKEDSFPGGACYLFTQLGEEKPDAKSVSGPKACVEYDQDAATAAVTAVTIPPLDVKLPDASVTIKPVTLPAVDVKMPDAPTLPDSVTIKPVTLPAVDVKLPDAKAGVFKDAAGADGKVLVQTEASSGDNTLMYGLIGGGVAAIAVGAGAYYAMSGGKKSKSKKKRAARVEEVPMIEEAPAQVEAPVMPAPGMEMYQAYQGQPMYQVQGAQMTPVPQYFYNQVPAYQPQTVQYQQYQQYQPVQQYQYPGQAVVVQSQ